MFTSTNRLPTEAEQQQTLRSPSMETGCFTNQRSARRLRFTSVLTVLFPIKMSSMFPSSRFRGCAKGVGSASLPSLITLITH